MPLPLFGNWWWGGWRSLDGVIAVLMRAIPVNALLLPVSMHCVLLLTDCCHLKLRTYQVCQFCNAQQECNAGTSTGIGNTSWCTSDSSFNGSCFFNDLPLRTHYRDQVQRV